MSYNLIYEMGDRKQCWSLNNLTHRATIKKANKSVQYIQQYYLKVTKTLSRKSFINWATQSLSHISWSLKIVATTYHSFHCSELSLFGLCFWKNIYFHILIKRIISVWTSVCTTSKFVIDTFWCCCCCCCFIFASLRNKTISTLFSFRY